MQYKILLLAIMAMVILPNYVCAQFDDTIRKHVIIAVDRYPENDNPLIAKEADAILDSLLLPEDYVSVVVYGIGIKDPSWGLFANCTLPWLTLTEYRKALGLGYKNWSEFGCYMHANSGPGFYSMQTGAKHFSLRALHGKNGRKYANKSYMLMITDERYNGNDDIHKEFERFLYGDGNGGAFNNPGLNDTVFFKVCRETSSYYNFLYLGTKDLKAKEGLKAILYEVLPNSSFSLNSVVDYPANLGLKRVRGGYRLNFKYNCVSPDYRIKKLELTILLGNDKVMTKEFAEKDSCATMDISNADMESNTLNVEFRGWLEKEDGIYSGLVLSPYDDYFKHLKVKMTLSLEEEAKIFGLIPLIDAMWWWCPDDQFKAVLIWDFIIAILFVVLVCFFAYRLLVLFSTYRPSNKKIKITHL